MGIILSAYTRNAFCEYLLPAINNADTEILLKKNVFAIAEDVVLKLEVINRQWFLKAQKENGPLKNGDILTVSDGRGNNISLIVRKTENTFSVFTKYDISEMDEITVGNESDNHIRYQNLELVSRHHAVIKRTPKGTVIQDISSNGTFVNQKKLTEVHRLQIGDNINIFGLKMIYLGNLLAVYSPEANACTVKRIPEYVQTDGEIPEKTDIDVGRRFFHRSPRASVKPETDTIEIEAPPNPKEESKKPLWMTIGPSFTMMLPMLAGSIMAIVGANAAGSSASIYRYTGIVTAVGSALIGVFWALTNIRYNSKEIKKGEEKRFQVYSEYLIQRTEYIRDRYEKYRSLLLDLYPSASVVITYGMESNELWSRNNKHEDFLFQRLGMGNLPFPMEINIPKERFTLINDDLSERPRIIKNEYSTLYDVPINIDLLAHKLIGIAGGEKKMGAYDIVRLLTAQVTANNCYTDVKMIFIYNKNKEEEDWEFTHWLPHVWAENKKTRFVASNKAETSDILYELTQVLRMRAEEEGGRKQVNIPKPYYILVVSDMELLEGELITKYIYDCNPVYGLSTLILAESREQLPNECEYLLQKDESFSGIYDLAQDYSLPVIFDSVSGKELELFARKLLAIEVREVEKGQDIPNSLSFFDMQGIQNIDELNVAERWRKNRTYDNMKALIGVKAGDAPCYLDVHEKYHGPHGLVAGTTGSGKSETLQTYMLSLAINFSPDDIGYFIIDYKGGGMAGLFDGLPHMIGSISNLSGSQVRRAMVSIKSENRRRQRIFSENNVNNISLYTKLYKSGEVTVPIPHMFIIIDEFAELKREEPEFMKEIISVAQVGRSLGVHLILATQKPSNTVDENIWSNAKFHLCLRVQDRQDSNEMLHKPDAAYITQAGRGYLQVGNDEVYDLFQSGYSGAIYDENGGNTKTEIASLLTLSGKAALIGNSLKSKQQALRKNQWVVKLIELLGQAVQARSEDLGAFTLDESRIDAFYRQLQEQNVDYPDTEYNRRRVEDFIQIYAQVQAKLKGLSVLEEAQEIVTLAEQQHIKLPETKSKTQLDAVIEHLRKVSEDEGYEKQMQLWMPLLPETLYLKELQGYSENVYSDRKWPQISGKWNLFVSVGLCDDPVNQAQMPLVVNFGENGHLAVCGTIVSGKSTFLQTMLTGLINRYQPDWLNLYILDFSSRMLSALEKAPHTGGVMYEDDREKIDKFFYMMENMVEERKKLFRGSNYVQYVQVNGVKVPAVLIAIDNLGAFREKTENKYDDKLIHLAKEGVSYGIYLAVTAAGFSSAEISSKIGDNIKTVICLQLNDRYAYCDAMRNNHLEVIPENNIKGRGLATVGESILEFQTALSVEADDDFKRMEQIRQLCEEMSANWRGICARAIPIIPEKPVWSEFEQLVEVRQKQVGGRYLPIGYNMESAAVHGIDLGKTFTYLVSGRARTGKSNLLKAVVRSAAQMNGRVVVIEHLSTDIKMTAQAVGAEYIDTQEVQAEFFSSLVEPFKQRNAKKRQLLEAGKEELEIYEAMQAEIPYFIVIADVVPFIQSIVKPKEGVLNIRKFVENIVDKGKLHNVFFFAGIDPDMMGSVNGTEIFMGLTKYHAGIHLGGAMSNIRYFDFGNISYAEQSKVQKAGIGVLPTGNDADCHMVVIPLVKG